MNALPKRHEVPVEHTWAVETVFGANAEWEGELSAVRALLPQAAAFQNTLGQSATQLLNLARLRDEVGRRAEKIVVFALLKRDEDTTDSTYQGLAGRAMTLGVDVGAAFSFAQPEILAIPAATLQHFWQECPELEQYRHAIEQITRMRPHVRSVEVEELLAQAEQIGQTPDVVYNTLTDADLKFPTINDENGEAIELSQGRYLRFIQSSNRAVRKAAFEGLYQGYAGIKNTTAATLMAAVRRNIFNARARRFGSALEASLHPNAIPTEVYHGLIANVRRRLPTLHRYFEIRRRALNLNELHMFDLYTPLAADVDRDVAWSEGVDAVLASLAPLGDEYVAIGGAGLRNRWVDIYENEGKTSGAYSWGAYDTQPFILMNFQSKWQDVFTLTHELGHSMHSLFTRRTQPYVYGSYTTFLAEIASTLNEALLVEHLLQANDDPRLRLFVINHQLESLRTTLFRQTMFAEFELAIHQEVEADGALTADSLSARYYELVRDYHGPNVVADGPIALEWSRIPHFYSAFYVFQYATGIIAANAMARQILTEGEPARDRFLKLLASGSSAYSVDLLRQAGVDMSTPLPTEQAMALFTRRLDELEALLATTAPT